MLAMMGAGIPVYVCATASVPVAAAFMAKGISAGAALVFLMTGPATNAATITTIWKVLGRKTALIYLATVAGSALIAGFLLDYIFTIEGIPAPTHVHEMLPGWLNDTSAVILLLILTYALLKPYLRKSRSLGSEMDMATATIQIKGMTCNHCAASVKGALERVAGVDAVEVDLQGGIARVSGEGYREIDMVEAVEKIGYSVVDQDVTGDK
jgi:copper chaperone CopZ